MYDLNSSVMTDAVRQILEDGGLTVTSDKEHLVRLLCAIRDTRARLADSYAQIERMLIDECEGDRTRRLTVEGIGEIEIKRSTKRTEWANDDLTKVLVARALDEREADPETGEYEPREQAVARILSECARPSWRVTALRNHGVDETEFCHVEPGSMSVMLPRTLT